jgi:hypothetical protein
VNALEPPSDLAVVCPSIAFCACPPIAPPATVLDWLAAPLGAMF